MDKQIETAREAALAVLKPSERELERGLALHRESIVFDSYGFAPTAPINLAALKALSEEGASQREFGDAREEMSMLGHLDDPEIWRGIVEAWEASGVTCVFQNAGEEAQSVFRLIKRLARFTHVVDMRRGFYRRAVVPDDVVAAHENGERCLYFSGNGVPLAERWHSPEEELAFIRVFFQLGTRMMHLTYNRRNMIGDGCGEKTDGGLSDFGEMVVKEMNRVGVVVDVAHSGLKTSFDAAKISSAPMVASHSCAYALNAHMRAKTDEVIKAIADTDGYVGVCCIPCFLGGGGDINAFLDHIEYIAKTFGVDRVAIGTDVGYSPSSRAHSKEKVTFPKVRVRWGALWPPNSLHWDFPERARRSLAWTNWPMFTVGLVQRGFSEDDIRKIIGGNVMRVARAVLSGS